MLWEVVMQVFAESLGRVFGKCLEVFLWHFERFGGGLWKVIGGNTNYIKTYMHPTLTILDKKHVFLARVGNFLICGRESEEGTRKSQGQPVEISSNSIYNFFTNHLIQFFQGTRWTVYWSIKQWRIWRIFGVTSYSMNSLFNDVFRKFGGVFLEVFETI